ncbi:hypothetical protein GCM10007907_27510 [Chitinimonas prasina]|uniref:Sel1 repeat family protein n=1 Tax=Chitinimonas prasina TaxID=1434937 RepID=A0ABQ5YHB2_9NEIS|nr:hypothetical protein GCM10007907_27510 [Chitinimonas prasina]
MLVPSQSAQSISLSAPPTAANPSAVPVQPQAGLFDRSTPIAARPTNPVHGLHTATDIYSEFLKYRDDPGPDAPAFAKMAMDMCAIFYSPDTRDSFSKPGNIPGNGANSRLLLDRCRGFLNLSSTEWPKVYQELAAAAIKRGGPASLMMRANALGYDTARINLELMDMIKQGNRAGLEVFAFNVTPEQLTYLLHDGTKGISTIEATEMRHIALAYALCDAGLPCGQGSYMHAVKCYTGELMNSGGINTTSRCNNKPDPLPLYSFWGASMNDLPPAQQQLILHWREQYSHAISNRDPSLFTDDGRSKVLPKPLALQQDGA